MDNNKEFEIKGEKEESIDISSFSNKPHHFEDISSYSGKHGKPKVSLMRRLKKWWNKAALWKKITAVSASAVALILVLAIGVAGYLYYYIGLDDLNQTSVDESDINVTQGLDDKIVNIALFGIDTRNTESFKGNSDSIMILSLNTKTNQVKIISVMRDTFVPITYNGKTTYGKINSAYAKGGPKLAIKTLNTLFNLNITDYATVNFFGMMDIIDAVGGIEATLTEGEVTKNLDKMALNGCIEELCRTLGKKASDYYIYKAGTHHLNGIQAVAYSRIRKTANIWGTNNDYGRTDRQRYVMEQLFNRAITMSKTRYIELAKSLIPCSETSLTFSDIYALATDILLDSPSFSQARIPDSKFLMSSPSGYGSVVYFDLDFAGKLIHSFIYDDISFEDYITANGITKHDWYRDKVGDYSTAGTPDINGNASADDTVSDEIEIEEPDETDSSGISSGDSSELEGTTSGGVNSNESNLSSNESNTQSGETSGEESKNENSSTDSASSNENVSSSTASKEEGNDSNAEDTSTENVTRRK